MNYKDFAAKGDHLTNMLVKLDIVKYVSRYVQINYDPDYEILEYTREDSNYYFKNAFDFEGDYQIVLGADISEGIVFQYDKLEDLLNEHELDIDLNPEDFSSFLSEMAGREPELLMGVGDEPKFEQFNLHCLRITYIENIAKQIGYDGSFFGYDSAIRDIDVYAELELKVVPHFPKDDHYKTLLGEAYLLYLQGNYKLSSFILFTAFDNFIEQFYGNPGERIHLEDKFRKVFKRKFKNLKRHNIYSQIAGNFKSFENLRNDIAHGNHHGPIYRQQLKERFLITLIMILTYTFSYSDFQKLLNGISSDS